MKNLLLGFGLLVSLGMVGCSNQVTAEELEISPSFTHENGEMFGNDQKLAIIGGDVAAGEEQKWMWHFWGDDLSGKEWEARAVHSETEEEVEPLVQFQTPLAPIDGDIEAHAVSSVMFPTEGIWKVQAYIEGEFFDEIIVEVLPEGAFDEEREAAEQEEQLMFAGSDEYAGGYYWANAIKSEEQVDIVVGINVSEQQRFNIEVADRVIFDRNNSYTIKGDEIAVDETIFSTNEEGHLLIRSTHPIRMVEELDQITIRILDGESREEIYKLILEEI
ncbi:hypothetical protein [Alkalicoccobacillus porphyridii]|uniref:hypothetical protein n=1 Tax=Alkalicoccobacillus porphyridii TaxID=2597270 RepID=UPI00163DCDC7|nr:hypothetical protein [Alkalicoccobacillus porphyridii]